MTCKRLPWLDVFKGIGIILVVIGHIYSNDIVFKWLYSFHMPLFFLAAGWVYKRKPILEDIKKRFQTIIIPYFTFGTITLLYWELIERKFRSSNMGFFDSLIGLFFGAYNNLDFNVHMWFLPCFFATVVFFNILVDLFSIKWAYVITILMSLIYATVPFSGGGGVLWGIDKVFQYLGFYAIGVILSKYTDISKLTVNRFQTLIIAFLLLAINFLLAEFGLVTGIMWFITALTGIVGVLLVSRVINSNKILQYFGRISLIILCTHGPIYRVIIKLVSILFHISTEGVRENFFLSMVAVIITLALCSLMYEIIIRIAPWMVGKERLKKAEALS